MLLNVIAIPAYASTSTATASVSPSNPEVSTEFIKVCDLVFVGNGEVINSDGLDITQNFIAAYLDVYTSNDYSTILSACYKLGISQFRGHGDPVAQISPRAYMTLSYDESVVHFVTQEGFPYDGKSWYFIVTATGTYRYEDGNQIILEVSMPTITTTFSDLGAAFSGSCNSTTIDSPVISSDRSYATIKVTTEHTVSCPIPGASYITGTLGPFTNISNFTIRF